MGGFEERFSKVGRALDDAKDAMRDKIEAGRGDRADSGRFRERWDEFKRSTHQKSEELWENYKGLPKALAAAYALGGLCVVLVVALLVTMNSGPGDAPPSHAKADEIATMAALRAKMSPNTVRPAPSGK